MNLVERVAKKAVSQGVPYRAAAQDIERKLAEQGKSAPKKVDDLFKEVKDGNPSYSDEQAWATAWSIYCKHVDPNGEHCHKTPGGYLKEAEVDPHAQVPKKLSDAAWEWTTTAMSGLSKIQKLANEEVRNVASLAEKLAVKAYAKEAEKAMHMVSGVFGRRMTASFHLASEAAKVRTLLAKSIKHMKDITGPKWEKFAKENPGLAAASINMAAQDAIRAMEEADKLLAMSKEAAAVHEGDQVEVTKGKEKGLKGTVKHTKAGPHGNQLAVDLDHPVHRMMGPAIIDPGAVRKIGADQAEGSIERPTPSAAEEVIDAPDFGDWEPWEKRGEWNLIVYHHGGRRNLSYFMKNPSGGGGGSNDGTSVKSLVNMVIHQTGWAVPHINPKNKDKVWVSVVQFDGQHWKPVKQWWEPVPAELLVPKPPKQLTNQEYYERLTR
jgi:transcription antitermination factor NusG